MSWRHAVKTRILDALKGNKSLRADLTDMQKQIAALQSALANRLIGGSSNLSGLGLDPPIVWLKLTSVSETFADGQRIYASIDDDETVILVDEDDTRGYRLEPEPWAIGLFKGARVYAIHAYNAHSGGGGPDQAIYRIIAGETCGFFARITGAPDGDGKYPWTQEWLSEADTYTHETVIDSFTFGKARPRSRVAYDSAITEPRIEFPSDTIVRMWYAEGYGFVFSGFEDAAHALC